MPFFFRVVAALRASRSSVPTTIGIPSELCSRWVLFLYSEDKLMLSRWEEFAKPRSAAVEGKDRVTVPVYKGDNINGEAFDLKTRTLDPQRLIRAYCQSAATLNLLRSFATGGYAAMQRVTQWNLDFAEHSEQGDRSVLLALLLSLLLVDASWCFR